MYRQSTEIKKYKVQKGDTLESIAGKLQITVEGLRSFHNRHCELEDLLGPKLKKDVRELYISSQTVDLPKKEINEKPETHSMHLLKRSYTKINKTYGVVQKTYENEELKTQIHYTVKIGNDVASDLPYNQLYIRKYKTYVNEKEIDLNIEQLYENLDQVLYPLKISLDDKGVPSSIVNKKEIGERWFKERRAEFKQYYVGELSEKIVKKLDDFFTRMKNYENRILNSLFYTFFFMPLYVKYDESREYHYEKKIPVFPFEEKVNYKIIQKLDEKLSSSGKIFVHMKGICTEERSGTEIAEGTCFSGDNSKENIPPEGVLEFTYKLDEKTKVLFSAVGYVSLKINSQITRKVKVEIYEL